ncbi:MAG: lytic transglycosylase domain-containing protein [Noviherbaspirillum sp.]
MRIAALLCGLVLACAAQLARADIYGYIDAAGNAHFAADKLDERYQLFLRGDGAFDSDDLGAKPAAPQGAVQRYLAQHPNLKKFEPLLTQAALDYTVELPLLKAIMAAESGFNPGAISPKGAIGLMQVMPATAERYGLQGDHRKSLADKLADPKTNIRLGARYLRDLMRLFPDQMTLVLASYNAGEGAVQKYRNRVPPYLETQNYVKLVTQFYHLYKPAPASAGKAAGGGARVFLTIPGRANLPTRPAPDQ